MRVAVVLILHDLVVMQGTTDDQSTHERSYDCQYTLKLHNLVRLPYATIVCVHETHVPEKDRTTSPSLNLGGMVVAKVLMQLRSHTKEGHPDDPDES